MCSAKRHVRFTPKSRHVQRERACPLSANSGSQAVYSITSSARAIVKHSDKVRPSAFRCSSDHHLVFRRCLYRKVGRLLALMRGLMGKRHHRLPFCTHGLHQVFLMGAEAATVGVIAEGIELQATGCQAETADDQIAMGGRRPVGSASRSSRRFAVRAKVVMARSISPASRRVSTGLTWICADNSVPRPGWRQTQHYRGI